MRRPRFGPLWGDRGFRRLWIGQTISGFGSEIGGIAFSVVAAVIVGVTPVQMGAIYVAGTLPSIVIGLFAGAWVDRIRRRRIIVMVNLAAAAVTAATVALVLGGRFVFEGLIVASALFGTLFAIAGPANEAFLPGLVGRDRLVDANARLEMGASAAATIGPGVGGVLVQVLTAPIALLLDAASFVVAAVAAAMIDAPADVGTPAEERRDILSEIREGIGFLARDPRLRAIALARAAGELVGAFTYTNYILFIASLVGGAAAAGVLGVSSSLGGLGFLVGIALAARLGSRLGIGRTIVASALLVTVSPFFMPLAPADQPLAATVLLATAAIVGATGAAIGHIHIASLGQAITPDHMLGRVSSGTSVLSAAALIVGTVAGGLVGTQFGLREAIWLSAIGHLVPLAIIILSPIPRIRVLPPVSTAVPITT